MKKQKLSLSKKLFLNKETISSLNSEQQQDVLGGGVNPATAYTCKSYVNGPACTPSASIPTNPTGCPSRYPASACPICQ